MDLTVLRLAAFFTLLAITQAFSKYGRTCKDIGCLTNEVCVMDSDPCSYSQRQNECGSYPTCKKQDNGPRTCSSYVCPPTKVCKMDGATPKCVDDHSKVGHVGYDESELRNGNSQPSGNLYPQVPRGETTPRPNVNYQQPAQQNPGYQGGQVGSGYPGQPRQNYPQQPAGGSAYPQQPAGGSAYPQQPYPGYNGYQGANQGGYPQQPNYGNYPTGANNYNYQNQRYPNNQQGGGYNPYGGYNGQQSNTRYGQKNEGSGFLDSITSALKTYGTKLLTDSIKKQITGQ